MKKHIIGASVGNCVHVAGVSHFLDLAEDCGYETMFLGAAVTVKQLLAAVECERPYMVSLGYRLTPENLVPILDDLIAGSRRLPSQPLWVFGGTFPTAGVAAASGFFGKVFDGREDIDDCIAFLKSSERGDKTQTFAQTLVARRAQKAPYPLLRHHFGLPSFAATLEGISEIADAGVLDVVSLGIDQNTQQFFFHPEQRDPRLDGAGGVPVADEAQFEQLYAASRCGNMPLMRCYSGTAEVLRFAEVLQRSIHNAWCAVPLCWYNELDRRGTRTLGESMQDAKRLISWNAQRDLPVELNEPHHWGLRDAHDVISVVMAYVSALNAKKLGVRQYVAQYMFNIPGSMSFSMDLAKVLAQIELTESLADGNFSCLREVRTGLPFLSSDLDLAKGQLAASTCLQMAVKPDIIHVVGYSEAEQAATARTVIESTRIVRGAVRSVLQGAADQTADLSVQRRKSELLSEARWLIDYINCRYESWSDTPLCDTAVLCDCIERGIIDAPHILKTGRYRGTLRTRIVDGKCVAWDVNAARPLSESERIAGLQADGRLDANALRAAGE